MNPAVIDEAPGVVAAPERIRGWCEIAQAGAEFVYATRCMLPVACPGAVEARRLQAAGLVQLFQRGIAGAAKNYVARRTAVPWPDPAAVRAAVPRADAADAVSAAVLDAAFAALERAARFGRPCPTDVQIATRVAADRDAVAQALAELRALGAIRIDRAPAPTLRVVTIVATGARTGMVAGKRA